MVNLKPYREKELLDEEDIEQLRYALGIRMDPRGLGRGEDRSVVTINGSSYLIYDAWRIIFGCVGLDALRYEIPSFKMGIGHAGRAPVFAQVCRCLMQDAHLLEDTQGYEDWAEALCYDTAASRTWQSYQDTLAQTAQFTAFLQEVALYNQVDFPLLWDIFGRAEENAHENL